MRYIVYILRNKEKTFHYVGMTNDLERRLKEHLSGYSQTTKKYLPLELVYTEECADRLVARKREKYFKSGAGREYRKVLLNE
jgi:putative endonuclease